MSDIKILLFEINKRHLKIKSRDLCGVGVLTIVGTVLTGAETKPADCDLAGR